MLVGVIDSSIVISREREGDQLFHVSRLGLRDFVTLNNLVSRTWDMTVIR